MPREIAHWHVLDRAFELGLPNNVANCLASHQASAYLGAVAHDAPYYLQFSRNELAIAVAEKLHGKEGEDTLSPLKSLAQQILDGGSTEASWAFLLGMISHWVTDITFHPMIYYFTGNYYASDHKECLRARARHRVLEVYLDAWFQRQRRGNFPIQLNSIISEMGSQFREISGLLDRAIPFTDPTIRWSDCLNAIAFSQRLFFSPVIGAFFRALSIVSPIEVGSLDALSSFRRRTPKQFFRQELEYQNPVTGERSKKTVDTLAEEAAQTCNTVFTQLSPLMLDNSYTVARAFGELPGLSLNFALPGVGVEASCFYSKVGLPIAGLSLTEP